jgi:3-hydroxyisobutyrate dehydrogenase-like beta-hydroxyacid dehydrogenase
MARKVGFIGLGLMGHGMAKNLLLKGYPLSVLAHRNRVPVDDLIRRGAEEAATPKALAEISQVVFLCVTGSPQVEEVVYGGDGILAGGRPGLILVDATTSDPTSTRRIAADLEKHGMTMADAPVTRAPKDAEAGCLNSLVGASPETFAAVEPLLRAYSENIAHFGPVGAGHTAKLVNNFISTGYAALIAEGMAVCAAMDVDKRCLYEVMAAGGADSGVLRKMIPPALDGDLSGHAFAIGNAEKDVGYYRQMVEAIGLEGSLSPATHGAYRRAVDMGLGDRLMASLMEMHEKLNDLKIIPR